MLINTIFYTLFGVALISLIIAGASYLFANVSFRSNKRLSNKKIHLKDLEIFFRNLLTRQAFEMLTEKPVGVSNTIWFAYRVSILVFVISFSLFIVGFVFCAFLLLLQRL